MTKKLDSFHLKLIAITAMLINHIGSGFNLFEFSTKLYFFTELIGKLTFPIMAFLLVEGYYHTKNVGKYASRLALFWLVSIYPFHLLHLPNSAFTPLELVNNIFFTLLMGLMLIILYEKTDNIFLHIALVIIFPLATIMSDWNLFGVLMIFGFYRIKDAKFRKIFPPLYITVIMFTILLIGFIVSPSTVSLYLVVSTLGILGTIPLLLSYNGQRGYSPKWIKWGFYLFYPLHMIVLVIIRGLL